MRSMTCSDNSSFKYGKYRHKVFKWCIPGHTSSQWQSTFQIFIRPSIFRWARTLLGFLVNDKGAVKHLVLPIVLVSSSFLNKKFCCLNNRNVFSQNSEGWKSEIRRPAWLCSGESSSPGFKSVFWLCPNTDKRESLPLFLYLEGYNSTFGLGPHPYDLA